jgi:hypothetical protein
MTWFAVLISGVLLNPMEVPIPNSHLVFKSASGKVIEVVTDKDGKFQVDLAPGTYRYRTESITVDKSTSKLKLHLLHRRALSLFLTTAPLRVMSPYVAPKPNHIQSRQSTDTRGTCPLALGHDLEERHAVGTGVGKPN